MDQAFTTRIEPSRAAAGRQPAPGTRIHLLPWPGYGGSESAVVASLDKDGERIVGTVPGDDKQRLFTRLRRGSIATAHVAQGRTASRGIDIDVRVEDFGAGARPPAGELLPTRPPRRTDIVRLDVARVDPVLIKNWIRQMAARAGEAENRGEDLRAFAADQYAEVQAFEERLALEDRARFRAQAREELELLDQSPPVLRDMLGLRDGTDGRSGGRRRGLWMLAVVAAAAILLAAVA